MPVLYITNMLHFWHSKNLPKLNAGISVSLYSNGCILVVILGLYFIIVMTSLHGDCEFTTTHCSTFYKAAGLIMG